MKGPCGQRKQMRLKGPQKCSVSILTAIARTMRCPLFSSASPFRPFCRFRPPSRTRIILPMSASQPSLRDSLLPRFTSLQIPAFSCDPLKPTSELIFPEIIPENDLHASLEKSSPILFFLRHIFCRKLFRVNMWRKSLDRLCLTASSESNFPQKLSKSNGRNFVESRMKRSLIFNVSEIYNPVKWIKCKAI